MWRAHLQRALHVALALGLGPQHAFLVRLPARLLVRLALQPLAFLTPALTLFVQLALTRMALAIGLASRDVDLTRGHRVFADVTDVVAGERAAALDGVDRIE